MFSKRASSSVLTRTRRVTSPDWTGRTPSVSSSCIYLAEKHNWKSNLVSELKQLIKGQFQSSKEAFQYFCDGGFAVKAKASLLTFKAFYRGLKQLLPKRFARKDLLRV